MTSSNVGANGRLLRRWLVWSLVFGAVVETSARIDDCLRWGAPLVGTYSNEALLMRDSLILRGRPGYRYEKWGMNALGFRGREISTAPGAGITRIAVIGASETFGLFEGEGGEYPARMQALFDSLAPGAYEVVNVGLPGMSPVAMIPYLTHAVAPLQPSYVVVYPSPSFFLFDAPPPGVFSTGDRGDRVAPASARWRPSLPELRTVTRTKEVLKRVVPVSLWLQYREWRLRSARREQALDWVWETVPADRMALFDTQMDAVVRTIREIGARPILVTHSNRFLHRTTEASALDRQHLLAVLSSYHPRASESVMIGVDSSANTILRRLSGATGAGLIETERVLPADGEHFADYSHFTDVGADMMARLLVRYFLEMASR